MQAPQIATLPDGRRLHLHHGPIDLIVDVFGPGREAALKRAIGRFQTILQELAAELEQLRQPVSTHWKFDSQIARNMSRATQAYKDTFVTPMAAVAGAVADEVLRCICDGAGMLKAYVNNGGDVAIFLAPGERFVSAIATPGLPTRIEIRDSDQIKGIATSGWHGRSQSLGIADSVTVLAASAAAADAAATLIANAVDLPGHPAVKRLPANQRFADSDLGDRLVTVGVGTLSASEVSSALLRGQEFANQCLSRNLITGACLCLRDTQRIVGAPELIVPTYKESIHA